VAVFLGIAETGLLHMVVGGGFVDFGEEDRGMRQSNLQEAPVHNITHSFAQLHSSPPAHRLVLFTTISFGDSLIEETPFR
jgi:hypothetical protein